MDKHFIGIDVGTYSSKGVLVDLAGQVLNSHVVEHTMDIPHPGWAEQDADRVWWADTVAICRALLQKSGLQGEDIGGVAFSAIGPTLLPLDAQDRPLRPGILYGVDTRAGEEIELLNQRYGAENIFRFSRMAFTSQAIGPKILWLQRHEPDVWRQTAHVTTASSYLVFRMTGEKVIDRHTASHYMPLVDFECMEWSDIFADGLIELDKLPALRWSDELAGYVSREAAELTGLKAGTPVAVGAVDALSEAISVGAVRTGDLMIMYGSTTFFILVLPQPIPDERVWMTAGAFAGQYNLAAGMATSGSLTRWFKDELARDLPGEDAYQQLFQTAEKVNPGADGLLMLPYFSGERTPINDSHARGVIAGLTLSHTREHLFRAALESVAYGIRHNIETFMNMGAPVERIIAVGGGTKSCTWLQIVSDVGGFEQNVPALTIGASYGDAYLAGLASGLLKREALHQWVHPGTVIAPDAASRQRYESFYQNFLKLYTQTKEIVHELGRLGK
jgi:xylulokinase